jgi:hypothetical protein
MKLRFRKNSLRLRVNRYEVAALAAGHELSEQIVFPGGVALEYVVVSAVGGKRADFDGKTIRVTAPLGEWAKTEDIGFYFEVEPGLSVAIEKDLECVDGPEDEKDPFAYPRVVKAC